MRSLTRAPPAGEEMVSLDLIERSRLAISESARLRHQLSKTRAVTSLIIESLTTSCATFTTAPSGRVCCAHLPAAKALP
jgi:hypothetical protein